VQSLFGRLVLAPCRSAREEGGAGTPGSSPLAVCPRIRIFGRAACTAPWPPEPGANCVSSLRLRGYAFLAVTLPDRTCIRAAERQIVPLVLFRAVAACWAMKRKVSARVLVNCFEVGGEAVLRSQRRDVPSGLFVNTYI
jgi:hypothetical protein